MTSARLLTAGGTSFRVQGVLDFATVGPLAAEGGRLFSGSGPLEIDLGDVVQANSAGLALLLEWLDLARRRGVSLRFRNLPDSVARIAELTNIANLLPVSPDGA